MKSVSVIGHFAVGRQSLNGQTIKAKIVTGELKRVLGDDQVGTFDTQLCKEFWIAFATNAGITLHIRQAAGENSHHIIEGAFKSVARSLKEAVAIDPAFAEEVPSTKGMLA